MKRDFDTLRDPAPYRLARLKEKHGDGWRSFAKYAIDVQGAGCMSGGRNGDEPVWYSFEREFFGRTQYADEVEDARIRHKGWFTDRENSDTMRGIVIALPHGRFLAGYEYSCNGERVFYGGLHGLVGAALMADKLAFAMAEKELAYQDRFQERMRIEEKIEAALESIRSARDWLHVAVAARASRDTPKGTRAAVLTALRARKQARSSVAAIRRLRVDLGRYNDVG